MTSGDFGKVFSKQLESATCSGQTAGLRVKASPQTDSKSRVKDEPQRQRVDGEENGLRDKDKEKDSKCDSSETDTQGNELAGILEGIGLLGLTDQQESPADTNGTEATEGEGQYPQDGEIRNISARMQQEDWTQLCGADPDAQAVQTDEAARSLENVGSAACAAQGTGKEVEKLSSIFDDILARSAEDGQNREGAWPTDGLVSPLDQQTETIVSVAEEDQGRNEANADTLLHGGKGKTVDAADTADTAKGSGDVHQNNLSSSGTVHASVEDTSQAAENESEAVPDTQEARENLNDIVESIRINSEADVQKFEVTLRPEHLGKLQISLVRDEAGISASLKADDHTLRQLLQPQMDELQQLLKDKGVPITKLEVVNEQSASTNSFTNRQSTAWQQNAYTGENRQGKNDTGQSAQTGTAATEVYNPVHNSVAASIRSMYSSVEFQA